MFLTKIFLSIIIFGVGLFLTIYSIVLQTQFQSVLWNLFECSYITTPYGNGDIFLNSTTSACSNPTLGDSTCEFMRAKAYVINDYEALQICLNPLNPNSSAIKTRSGWTGNPADCTSSGQNLDVYFFNVTNPSQVALNYSLPILQEYSPVFLTQYSSKNDINYSFWNISGIVRYNLTSFYMLRTPSNTSIINTLKSTFITVPYLPFSMISNPDSLEFANMAEIYGGIIVISALSKINEAFNSAPVQSYLSSIHVNLTLMIPGLNLTNSDIIMYDFFTSFAAKLFSGGIDLILGQVPAVIALAASLNQILPTVPLSLYAQVSGCNIIDTKVECLNVNTTSVSSITVATSSVTLMRSIWSLTLLPISALQPVLTFLSGMSRLGLPCQYSSQIYSISIPSSTCRLLLDHFSFNLIAISKTDFLPLFGLEQNAVPMFINMTIYEALGMDNGNPSIAGKIDPWFGSIGMRSNYGIATTILKSGLNSKSYTEVFKGIQYGNNGFGAFNKYKGSDISCSFDRDCLPKNLFDLASSTSSFCNITNPNCIPNYSIGYDFTSIHGSYFGQYGDESYHKVGTLSKFFSGQFFGQAILNNTYVEAMVNSLLVDIWNVSYISPRLENCLLNNIINYSFVPPYPFPSSGKSTDSPGIDCYQPNGTIYLGPYLSFPFTPPIYLSSPFYSSTNTSNLLDTMRSPVYYPLDKVVLQSCDIDAGSGEWGNGALFGQWGLNATWSPLCPEGNYSTSIGDRMIGSYMLNEYNLGAIVAGYKRLQTNLRLYSFSFPHIPSPNKTLDSLIPIYWANQWQRASDNQFKTLKTLQSTAISFKILFAILIVFGIVIIIISLCYFSNISPPKYKHCKSSANEEYERPSIVKSIRNSILPSAPSVRLSSPLILNDINKISSIMPVECWAFKN